MTLFETVGLPRVREPVDLSMAFTTDQVDDPVRKFALPDGVRLERRLQQIPSQVYAHSRHASKWNADWFSTSTSRHTRRDIT